VRLFSAGRLDKESSGLILFSNDGDFVAQLTHPKYQIVKRYVVRLASELTSEAQKQMVRGIKDEGEFLKVLKVVPLGGCRYELYLNEGKKREIRRLTAALGAPTLELDRLSIGALELGKLPRGEWRRLDLSEVKAALTPMTSEGK
jgi:pseudouridine synthase